MMGIVIIVLAIVFAIIIVSINASEKELSIKQLRKALKESDIEDLKLMKELIENEIRARTEL